MRRSRIGKMRRLLILRLAAVAVIGAGLALASWQFGRAEQKRQLETQAQAGLAAAALDINAAPDSPLPVFRRARVRGVYLPDKTILLDNRIDNRRAGYYVITPLLLADGAAIAINRGWIPAGKTRIPPPVAPPPPDGEVVITGRLAKDESDFFALSAQNQNGIVWQRLLIADYAAAFDITLLPRVLIGEGERGLQPPPPAKTDFRSARSVGYAFQWLGLSLVAVVFYFVLARKMRRGDK